MPIAPAFPAGESSPFYSAVIDALTSDSNVDGSIKRLHDDEHKTHVVVNSIAQCSLAMYESNDGKDEVNPNSKDVIYVE